MKHLETIGVLLLGTSLLGGGSYVATRSTRGTQSTRVRKEYDRLLKRARERVDLLDKSMADLRRLRKITPPRLFTIDTDEVEEILRRVHRREMRACTSLAAINLVKTRTEVSMNSQQVLRSKKLNRRFAALQRELRGLEKHANAKGVRLDKARPCPGDAPNVEKLQQEVEERNRRRLAARSRAKQRTKAAARDKKFSKKAKLNRSLHDISRRLNEYVDAAGGDEEAFEEMLAEDHDFLQAAAETDIDVLIELAEDYPAVLEAAKSLGILDDTKEMFE